MNKIIVYYQDNKNYALEERIKESALALQGKLLSDFEFNGGVFSMAISFQNEGQEHNFKQALNILNKAFKTNATIGGYGEHSL